MSHIDLNAPPPGHKFNVSVDREESVAERNVRLFKELAFFLTALAFVGMIAGLCYSTLTSSSANPEEKKWAMSVLSAAAGGIVGYLVRR